MGEELNSNAIPEEEVKEEVVEVINSEEDINDEDIVDVDFPEYYFSGLSGDTLITCILKDGTTVEKTIEDIYNKNGIEPDQYPIKTYALGGFNGDIKFADVEFNDPEKVTDMAKITFSNGLTVTLSTESMIFMCNSVWAPVSALEVGDVVFKINFSMVPDKEGENKPFVISTIATITNIEYVDGTMYGFISSHSNILLAKAQNDNEISFIAIQQ